MKSNDTERVVVFYGCLFVIACSLICVLCFVAGRLTN